uniref:recombinase A n=1 Tax=Ningiella ruwaisensis TaxID=2364274 RepID=UPI00109F6378|nr:recombinase A [Ningiella ruwaisensis]
MNPILHELQNKQWVWTAAQSRCSSADSSRVKTGFKHLDKALSGGFPAAGMVHIHSHLGCGELRLMLAALQAQTMRQIKENETQTASEKNAASNDKLWVFIAPPFVINAEFLLAHNINLNQVILIQPDTYEEVLWSAEQCAKSGACASVFIWQNTLKHQQVRRLELASLQGQCHCFWFDNSQQQKSNLPLSLSLSLTREDSDILQVKINKQKVGWAKAPVKVKVPFVCRTGKLFTQKQTPLAGKNIVHLHKLT